MSAYRRIADSISSDYERVLLTDTVENVPFQPGSENFQAVQARQ
jgi:hypothetical protein